MKKALLLSLGFVAASVFADESIEVKARRLFDSLNHNGGTFLSIDELTEYELASNPNWSDSDFLALPGYKDLARAKARKKAGDDFAFYANNLSPTNPQVDFPNFVKFLKDNDPKFRAPPNGSAPTPSPVSSVTTASQFHLNRSSTAVKDEKLPALLSWTVVHGSKAIFAVDGALSYTFDLGTDLLGTRVDALEFAPTLEAHTSNDPTASQDSLSIKPMVWAVFPASSNGIITSHYVSLSPDYERDYKGKTETLGLDGLYSPTSSVLDIGGFIPLTSDASGYPGFLWRPYVGAEYGHAFKSDGTEAFKAGHNYVRLLGKIHFDLVLAKQAQISVDYFHRKFLSGTKESYDYVEVSPIYYLGEITDGKSGVDSKYSVGLTYKNGRTTPKFTPVDSLGAWFGVQF